MLLKIKDLSAYYKHTDTPAIKNISLEADAGEIVALLGPNGSGKSTVLKSIVGWVSISEGEIILLEKNLRNIPSHHLAALGVSYIPEGQRVLGNLTVLENLEIGAYICKDKKAIKANIEKNLGLFPKLKPVIKRMAQTLSGGERQMLALARGLMLNPKLLLLDEPSLGLAPNLVEEVFEAIAKIAYEMGVSILLVEQNTLKALEVSTRTYLLENGQVMVSGNSLELSKSQDLQRIFLGG